MLEQYKELKTERFTLRLTKKQLDFINVMTKQLESQGVKNKTDLVLKALEYYFKNKKIY